MVKINGFTVLLCMVLNVCTMQSQSVSLNKDNLKAVNTSYLINDIDNEEVIRVTKNSNIKEFDAATFVRVDNCNFTNGTIEVKVLSRLLADAPDFSRGFIGIAFHVNDDNSLFECIYLRPTNARVEDQVRRNHSIQYFAYPDYKFERLRREYTEMYESYADMGLNEWIQLRIEVEADKAKLYLNNNEQPSLIINDLKLGGNKQGVLGLFVDVGTEGFFKDLVVTRNYSPSIR